MALFVIVQSVTINSESWPSILGEALEDLNLLWKPMEEAWTTPDFPRGSPVFPHMDAWTLRIQTWSTVSALLSSHRGVGSWRMMGPASQIVVEQSLPRTQPKPKWKSKVCTIG